MGPVKSVALAANPDKPSALKAAHTLKSWLKRRRIEVLPRPRLAQADFVVTLGGDGTILAIAPEAARAGLPVLGINIGRLGFMTGVETGEMIAALERCLDDKWHISERMMLEVTAPRSSRPQMALNDAVIRIGSTTRVTTVVASIEKENLGRFTGDGIIVATPTGSTAYSLAAQGPVVHPEVDAFVLTPICAHSFTQRPVVYPARHTLELQLADPQVQNEVQLCLDGQRVIRLKNGDIVTVRRSPFKLRLLQNPRVPYFGVLREKLSWGER